LAVKHINLLIISTNTGLHVSTPSSHHQFIIFGSKISKLGFGKI
jgi:hypothetical protein